MLYVYSHSQRGNTVHVLPTMPFAFIHFNSAALL